MTYQILHRTLYEYAAPVTVSHHVARLEAAGVDVVGITDHHIIQSIYFFDPNGIRLEMTLRTEAPGELNRMERAGGERLAAWNARKQRKYGARAAVSETV